MNEITNSQYTCPVCHVTLAMEDVFNGSVAVFCTEPKCPSLSSTEGAIHDSERGAYDKLCRRVEAELTMNDQV